MPKDNPVNSALPPAPAESPELWKKLVAQLQGGKFDDAGLTLEKMNLSKKLVNLFAVALQEERELAAIISAGENLADKIETLKSQFQNLTNFTCANLAEIEKISGKKTELQKQIEHNLILISRATTATPQRRHLKIWLAELFGEPPMDAAHKGALSSCIAPPRCFSEAAKLSIDVFKLGSWRFVDKEISEYPRRKYTTSFTPQPAFTTIHS
jgi:hypothetical protein